MERVEGEQTIEMIGGIDEVPPNYGREMLMEVPPEEGSPLDHIQPLPPPPPAGEATLNRSQPLQGTVEPAPDSQRHDQMPVPKLALKVSLLIIAVVAAHIMDSVVVPKAYEVAGIVTFTVALALLVATVTILTNPEQPVGLVLVTGLMWSAIFLFSFLVYLGAVRKLIGWNA